MFKICWNNEDYHSNVAQSLFDVFSEYYALNNVKIIFKDDEDIVLEKYNVIGWDSESDVFNVYETSSLEVKLNSFNVNSIKSLYVLY